MPPISSTSIGSLSDLLLQPAGSLAYALVLIFALAGALQMALFHWQASRYPQSGRLLRGVALLLGLRLLFFLAQALSWQGLLPASWLPGIDRFVQVSSALWLAWLWAFPEPDAKVDTWFGAAFLALLFLLGVTLRSAPLTPSWTFNTTPLDRLWSSLGLGIAVGGLGLLFWRSPDGALFGVLALALLGIGHASHLWLGEPQQSFSLALRLSELGAYPFLFSLFYRYTLPMDPSPAPLSASTLAPPPSRPQDQALESLLQALTASSPDDRSRSLVQAASQRLVADIALLITPPSKAQQIQVVAGYDLIREQFLEGGVLEAAQLPLTSSALEKGRALRLPASSTSQDLQALVRWLGLAEGGPLLVVPLKSAPDAPPLGGLIWISPYAQHNWTNEEQQQAQTFAAAAARLLLCPLSGEQEPPAHAQEDLSAQVQGLQQALAQAQQEREEAEARSRALAQQLDTAQEQVKSLTALLEEFRASQEEEQKQASQHQESAREVAQLKQTLRMALEEIAALKAELNLREEQFQASEQSRDAETRQRLLYQSLLSLAQEVRQHLSTVIGYTDLLLDESVGLLGHLQREFLVRIRSAATKVVDALEDVMHLTAVDLGIEGPELEPVELAAVLDEVLAANRELLREKDLTLRVDLPEALPSLHMNRDALHQILHNLIRNAALVSPAKAEVQLRVAEYEEEGRFVQIQVRDSGPGIAPDNLPRVFSRIYRTGYRTIEGVGDNGVGLPLVKALTEASGGRVWVESTLGQGATFNVLLPVLQVEAGTQEGRDEGEAVPGGGSA